MTENNQRDLDDIDVFRMLRAACYDAGSQRAFARQVGCSQQFVHSVLSAKRRPTTTMLAAIGLRAVNVTKYVPVLETV